MKIVIYHFSDSHWRSKPTEAENQLFQYRVTALERTDFSKHTGDCRILLHTGDFADLRPPCSPLSEQFDQIKSEFLPHLRELAERLKIDRFLAVPGNHDVDKDESENPNRYKPFLEAMKGWRTPFNDNPLESISLTSHPGDAATLLLLNSTHRMGKDIRFKANQENSQSDGPQIGELRLECPHISDSEMRRLEKIHSPNDIFRIAAVHHNPLPHYGQHDSPNKLDVFVNSGDFCKRLREHNIKLLLCGHQHIMNLAYYSLPDAFDGSNASRPILDSGFTIISAPAFSTASPDTLPGFNVLEIETESSSNLASVCVSRYRRNRESPTAPFEVERVDSFWLPMRRIHDVKNGKGVSLKPEEIDRRMQIVRRTTDYCYDAEAELYELEYLLKASASRRELSLIRDDIAACGRDIFALYSMNVLSPAAWWTNELTIQFQRAFSANIRFAFALGASEGSSNKASFKFSLPLYCGIRTARALGLQLSVQELIAQREERFPYDEEMFLALATGHRETKMEGSLSNLSQTKVTATAPSASETGAGRFERVDPDLSVGSSDACIDPIAGPFPQSAQRRIEIARILLWPQHYFNSDIAWKIIQFHEDFLVPLFWLDPNRLVTRKGGDFKRKEIGLFVMYASHYKPLHSDGPPRPQTGPRCYYTTTDGRLAVAEDYYRNPHGAAHVPCESLWGVDGGPVGYEDSNHPSTEIALLLSRPDIMFAIDAWAMNRMKKWEQVEACLHQRDTMCVDWLSKQLPPGT